MEKNEQMVVVGIILLIVGAIGWALVSQVIEESNDGTSDNQDAGVKHLCSQNERIVKDCVDTPKKACGWFNESIKCFKYPCAQTYSGSCQACKDQKVQYWTEGECPK